MTGVDIKRSPSQRQRRAAVADLISFRYPEPGSLMTKTVDQVLAEARAALPSRLSPNEAARAQDEGSILIDIRGEDQIRAGGSIPGALRIPRNVLEWRCDPTSPYRHPSIHAHDQRLVVICNEGFQSSLAAAYLQQLGFASATDMDGGFVAWKAAGLPIVDVFPSLHWDKVYFSQDPDRVSWHQPAPDVSLRLIESLGLAPDAAIIDLGGGASRLAPYLLQKGFTDVTVLDASAAALGLVRSRTGAEEIHFVHCDLLDWVPNRRYDVWHDRALFHFFVNETDQRRYLDLVNATLTPGGHVIIATFAEDGPEHCSGLPTARYSPSQLASVFGPSFRVVERVREEHQTPSGDTQPFTWLLLQTHG